MNRMPVIGITCYPSQGGSGVVASELGLSLARFGHEVHFITSDLPLRLRSYESNIFFHRVETASYPLFQHSPYTLALARAFLRQAPLIIMDEPTSAMDSWAEGDWMARFRSLAAGRTALVITHRFTTALQADVIHVMDAGRIVESGSHEELVASQGRYSQSWKRQTGG